MVERVELSPNLTSLSTREKQVVDRLGVVTEGARGRGRNAPPESSIVGVEPVFVR